MSRAYIVTLLLAACGHARATEPAPTAAQPITAVKLAPATWKPGAIGVVRVTDSDAKGFAVEIVMPAQELDGLSDTTMDATVASPGTLEIFDGRGLVGTLPIGPMRVKFWCENDGGTQARPTWIGRIERSTLKRALDPNREIQDIAAFVRAPTPTSATHGSKAVPHVPPQPAYEGSRVAMTGVLTAKSGAIAPDITAEILTAPDQAGNCDGAPANNLTITLRSARGDVQLRCCGP